MTSAEQKSARHKKLISQSLRKQQTMSGLPRTGGTWTQDPWIPGVKLLTVKSVSGKRVLADWLKDNDPKVVEWFAALSQTFGGDHTYGYSHRDDLYQALKTNSRSAKNDAVSKARRTLVTG